MSLHIEVKLRRLTNYDRCDRCGAKAKMLAKTPAGELVFCGHHASQHAAKFIELGYPITSERDE